MPGSHYLLFSTLTNAGRRSLHLHPERIEVVNRGIEQLGCRVIAQYALQGAPGLPWLGASSCAASRGRAKEPFGRFDFLTVVEAPDNETVAHLSADLGSRGTVEVMSLPAIPAEQLLTALLAEDQIGRPVAGPIASFRPLDGGPLPAARLRS